MSSSTVTLVLWGMIVNGAGGAYVPGKICRGAMSGMVCASFSAAENTSFPSKCGRGVAAVVPQ
ncbi:MAG: hypothetical protein K2X43_19160 [Hyphomonadaceae bacterium]|jgi:hypothetical protein|nr:hypothetical protein [Hyphomonadaceae bacterium]